MFRASIARRNVGRFRHTGAISQTFITPSSVLPPKYVLLHPRYYSTPVSSSHITQIQSEKAQLHPSAPPEHRKPTVDLRPGPRKTSSSTSPPVHAAPIPTATPIQPQPPSILPAPPRPPKSEEGILKSALNDVDEAIRIGELPPIPVGAEGLKLNWHKLKSMFMFYMRGIKLLAVEHRQQSSQMQRLAKEEKREMSWRERRFVETYRTDLMRLAPFVLVFAVIEELIPVIILYAPGFLPSTCKLQPQQDRIDNLADDKRYEALSDAQTLLKKLPSSVVESSDMSVHELPAELVPLMCKVLSVSSYGLEWLGRMRLQQRLTKLTGEDALLSRQQELTDREIKAALAERGFATRTLTTPHLRPRLDWWLDNAQGGAMSVRLRLLLKLAQGRGDVPA